MILTTNLLNKDSTELIINSLDKENRIFDAIKKKRASRTEPNRLLSEGGYKFDPASCYLSLLAAHPWHSKHFVNN